MCGRYSLWAIDLVGRRFRVVDPMIGYRSHFNIAPATENPVVIGGKDGNHLRAMSWGLVPSWTKDIRNAAKPINARAETLHERPAFRDLLNHNRCIVPANGFFEWKAGWSGKEPYFIGLAEKELFGFAGLYDTWAGPGNSIVSYTIITTEPNDLVRPYHNRMPVILRKENEDRWLSPSPLVGYELPEILAPYPAEGMIAYPVPSRVNDVLEDGEELVRPVAGGQRTL